MIERKAKVVDQTTGGVKFLMDKNNIDVYTGIGSFEDSTHVKITKEDNTSEIIEATNIIIATGSKPASLPFINIDKERIISIKENNENQYFIKSLLGICKDKKIKIIANGVKNKEDYDFLKNIGVFITDFDSSH